MGARETKNAEDVGCPSTKVGFQEGNINEWCDLTHYWSLHPGGANFLFADGAVRFLTYGADKILRDLSTRGDGELIADDY